MYLKPKKLKLKGKTKKPKYSGSKRFDRSCRNHGSCPYCERDRLFFDRKRRIAWKIDLEQENI